MQTRGYSVLGATNIPTSLHLINIKVSYARLPITSLFRDL